MLSHIILGFISGGIGFLTCALLTAGHNADMSSEAYIHRKKQEENDPLDRINVKL